MHHALAMIVRLGALAVIGLAALPMGRVPRHRTRVRALAGPGPAPAFSDTQPLAHPADDWYLTPARTGTER